MLEPVSQEENQRLNAGLAPQPIAQEPVAPIAVEPAPPVEPAAPEPVVVEPTAVEPIAVEPVAEPEDFRKVFETKIFETTGGQAKTLDESLEYIKNLEAKANRQPVLDGATLLQLDAMLHAEKGHGLQEALYWSKLDIAGLPEKQKLELSIRVQNEHEPDSFIQREAKKFDILNAPDLQAKIDDGIISQERVDELTVERERILHKSEKILSEYKEKMNISANFVEPTPKPSGPSPEQISQGKRLMSEAIAKLDKETVRVKLPLDLGEVQIDIPISAEDKHATIQGSDMDSFQKRYVRDGNIDYGLIARDNYFRENRDKILSFVAQNAAANAVKEYQKTLENVRPDRQGTPAATATGKSFAEQAAENAARRQQR
jgi:hypothetical protein